MFVFHEVHGKIIIQIWDLPSGIPMHRIPWNWLCSRTNLWQVIPGPQLVITVPPTLLLPAETVFSESLYPCGLHVFVLYINPFLYILSHSMLKMPPRRTVDVIFVRRSAFCCIRTKLLKCLVKCLGKTV